jgi:hypothetical protein
MGVPSPKLNVDVVVRSCDVADWQWSCTFAIEALIDVDDSILLSVHVLVDLGPLLIEFRS